jgi:hypothetical protein
LYERTGHLRLAKRIVGGGSNVAPTVRTSLRSEPFQAISLAYS